LTRSIGVLEHLLNVWCDCAVGREIVLNCKTTFWIVFHSNSTIEMESFIKIPQLCTYGINGTS